MTSSNNTRDERTDDIGRADALRALSTGDDDDGGRRGFLRGVAATALAAVGFTGTAAALDSNQELRAVSARFDRDAVARATFERQSADLLGRLSKQGIVEEGTAAAIAENLNVSAHRAGGDATARLGGSIEQGDSEIVVAVEPELDRSYAIVKGDGGNEAYVVEDGEFNHSAVCEEMEGCLEGGFECEPWVIFCCGGTSCLLQQGRHTWCGTDCFANCGEFCSHYDPV